MKQAIILAGGRGERLRPLTQDRPKCMVEVLGGPILGYQLRWLKSYGIKRVVIACGYLHEIIQNHFGSGQKHGIEIVYAIEDSPLGRGGALKRAWQESIQDEDTVLCLNGDIVCNLSIDDLHAFHNKSKPLATILTVPLRSPFGIVEVSDNDTISAFSEKPELPYYVNAGIYVMDKGIVEKLPDVGDHETETFPELSHQGKLKAFRSHCFWRSVDTIKDVNELKRELGDILMNALF